MAFGTSRWLFFLIQNYFMQGKGSSLTWSIIKEAIMLGLQLDNCESISAINSHESHEFQIKSGVYQCTDPMVNCVQIVVSSMLFLNGILSLTGLEANEKCTCSCGDSSQKGFHDQDPFNALFTSSISVIDHTLEN